MPLSGFVRDGLISVTSLTTCSSSPGRAGRGQAIFSTGANDATGDGHAAREEQSHRQGGRVPAAGRKAGK